MGIDDKEKDIGPLFRQINEGIRRNMDCRMQDMNLTTAQTHVLGYLRCRRDQGLVTTQKDLEEHLKVSHPTVVGIIKRLCEKEFVRTEQDRKDRRMKNLYLTDRENEVFDEMDRRRVYVETSLMEGFSDAEVAQLTGFLDRIINNIEKNGVGDSDKEGRITC